MYDVAIIGCGVTGAAAAYELARYRLRVCVLERENDVADGTTKANSAILHAGYDPQPGTLMAELNVKGVAMAKEICKKLDVEYRQLGSLVLAFDEAQMATVRELYDRGVKNGVPGVRVLTGDEVRAMEPNISDKVVGALLAPSAAIVMPWDYAIAMAETAVRNGVEVFTRAGATAIQKKDGHFVITTPRGDFEAKYIVNAAGTAADQVHALAGGSGFSIRHVRGQYYLMDKSQGALVDHVVFQCPANGFKGILVSPTVDGNLIVGPDAQQIPEDDVSNTADALEYIRNTALRSVPSINFRESIRNFAGVRAESDRGDFIIEESPQVANFVNLAGIKSPGLSSAPAIAVRCREILQGLGLAMVEKDSFIDTRTRVRFKKLSPEDKAALIKKDPRYGRVICRCETVTEGEIVEAIHRPIVPTTIDAVKRRCNPGMGRCQGGFCGPRVHEILSRELGKTLPEIQMDEDGTYILTEPTKGGANK